jgi:hypothetical protein
MILSKRQLAVSALALLGSLSIPQRIVAQGTDESLPLPRRESFESGDFLWPKKPGAYVPYNSGGQAIVARDDAVEWEVGKQEFLKRIENDPGYFTKADIAAIRELTYREFYARYAGDQQPDMPGVYSAGSGIYVGHVGIVDIDGDGKPWVIEALMGDGVVRTAYDKWLLSRPGQIVWQGRIREISKQDRKKIVIEAMKYLGRPYDFWNFDLNKDDGFYCSKLVWMAVFRSLGFAIDGKANPQRTFWFSPKQLLYAKTITRLHDPGPYANL